MTIRLVRAIAAACKAEPVLNTWFNSSTGKQRLVARVDVDLGIAVDTP